MNFRPGLKSWWLGFSPVPGGPRSPLEGKVSPTLLHIYNCIPSRAGGDRGVTTVPGGPGSGKRDQHLEAE